MENISLLSSDNVVVAADISNDSTVDKDAVSASTIQANWWLDEHTPASGDVPEWFNGKKYKTVTEQAKAQRELEKHLGGFTGAPEQYQLDIEGIEADELYSKVSSIARELNMSNEAFNKLVGAYAEHAKQSQAISKAQIDAYKITEMNKLGVNAQEMINGVQSWVANNFTPEEQHVFTEMAISSDAIKLLGKIKDMVGKSMAQAQPVANVGDITNFQESEDTKLEKMIQDPRYKTDTAYFDYVNQRYQERYS